MKRNCWAMILFLIASCGLFNRKDNEQTFIPLTEGNYWVYHQWFISTSIADTIRTEIMDSYHLELGGVPYIAYSYQQFLNRANVPPEDGLQWLWTSNREGILSLGGVSKYDTLLVADLWYKYPSKMGDVWQRTDVSYHWDEQRFVVGNPIVYELVSTDVTLESTWGTFEGCFVYLYNEYGDTGVDYGQKSEFYNNFIINKRYTNHSIQSDPVYHWRHYIYIKPGIGIVGVETKNGFDETDLVGQMILIDWKLN